MKRTGHFVALLALAALVIPSVAIAATGANNLAGSPLSMERQHGVAVAEDYNFLATPAEVRESAEEGRLVSVTENADLEMSNVSFPFVRPDVRTFIERLAAEYHAALGEKLVVTSLTRPMTLQLSNAHELSVHPAGMAVDFRVPARSKARVWLERALLDLERAGVLDVTREHTPPHYHVAVYPAAYRAYAAQQVRAGSAVADTVVTSPVADSVVAVAPAPVVAKALTAGAPSGKRAGGSLVEMLVAAVGAGLGVFGIQRKTARG